MNAWESTLRFPRPFTPVARGKSWTFDAGGRVVTLSNLTKVFWPDTGYTKGDLLAAYNSLAPLILPHLHDRPLTLLRMPDGVDGVGFFEKQAPAHTPEWMPRAHVESRGPRGSIDYLLAQDEASLLFVANLGCVEMHPLHSRAQHPGRPDYAFFDLDPFPPITFAQVRRVALMIRVALEGLGLSSYPKTSGATGMQIYLPLDGSHSYEEARAFVERVCRMVLRAWPDGTTMEHEIAKRSGKVFLDHAMVREGANIASAYSIRPTPFANVSTPLRWEEVEQDIEPQDFTIANVWDRFAREGDLFAPVLAGGTSDGQNLNAAMQDLGIDPSRFAPAPPPRSAAARPLTEYHRKRSFAVTPEPEGAPASAVAAPIYMIHKHHARRLHYDLRLERDGVLVSFAVPKGLPEEAGVRRLAVHVEDHPLEYGAFEGRIPQGEYGAGEVRIFDAGTYDTLEWTDDKITVRLRGERIQGEYHLVRTKRDADAKNWLVFRSARDAPSQKPVPPPDAFEPMLATSTRTAFDSADWVFEPKWDGVRTVARIDGEELRLASRRGRNVSALYPEVATLPHQLSGTNAIIDGEIVALDAKGRPSFELIQRRFTAARATPRLIASTPVDFLAFDLLWLDGESLVQRPLQERRALLERNLVPGGSVQISPQIAEHGISFFEAAATRGLEGIMAKRLGSIYEPGRRSRDWLKIKATKQQDCVVIGWSSGAAGEIGSLLCAVVDKDGLRFAGHCGTGFSRATSATLHRVLGPLEVPQPPIAGPLRDDIDTKGVHWVRPEVVCAVEYMEFTSQGSMRAASFKGLRDDKSPEECVVEQ